MCELTVFEVLMEVPPCFLSRRQGMMPSHLTYLLLDGITQHTAPIHSGATPPC